MESYYCEITVWINLYEFATSFILKAKDKTDAQEKANRIVENFRNQSEVDDYQEPSEISRPELLVSETTLEVVGVDYEEPKGIGITFGTDVITEISTELRVIPDEHFEVLKEYLSDHTGGF